jgi:hypothetical protein
LSNDPQEPIGENDGHEDQEDNPPQPSSDRGLPDDNPAMIGVL